MPIKGDAPRTIDVAAPSGDRSSGKMRGARIRAELGGARCHPPGPDFGKPERARTVAESMARLRRPGPAEPERDDGGRRRAGGVDDRRSDSTAARPGRVHARIVGRRRTGVGRLSRASGLPAYCRTRRRAHLDGQRTGRGRSPPGGDRRRRLRRRHSRADHPRSPDADGQGDATADARRAARGHARCFSNAGAPSLSTPSSSAGTPAAPADRQESRAASSVVSSRPPGRGTRHRTPSCIAWFARSGRRWSAGSSRS